MATKNWVYGVKRVTDAQLNENVTDRLYDAHRLRNKLCEIALASRDKYKAIFEEYDALIRQTYPDYHTCDEQLAALKLQLEEVRTAIKEQKKLQRKKVPNGVESLKEQADHLKKQKAELTAAIKAGKKAVHTIPEVAAAMAENNEWASEANKQAEKESGLYWGTKAAVRETCKSFRKGKPPRFTRWTGQGQLGIQMSPGLSPDTVLSSNTLFYIEGEGKIRQANFRIGSDANRRPLFARFNIVYHRPLPEDCTVKGAYLERRAFANKYKYKLRLVIDIPDPQPKGRKGSMGVLHLGWRSNDDGSVRVGIISNGQKAVPIDLPWKYFDGWDKVDLIRSERDLSFNTAKIQLAARLKSTIAAGVVFPEFLSEAKAYLHVWRSPGRLVKLARQIGGWMDAEFIDQEDCLELRKELQTWISADRVKWQHETRLRSRLINWRNNVYRNWAASLANRVQLVAVSELEAKKLTEHGNPEDLRDVKTHLNRRARLSAVKTLQSFVAEKFPCRLIEVDSKHVSVQCANCGHINKRSDCFEIECAGCGAVFDIDTNAAINTMTRAVKMVEDGHLQVLLDKEAKKVSDAEKKREKMQQGRRDKTAARKKAAAS